MLHLTPVELRYNNGAKHVDDDANPLQFFVIKIWRNEVFCWCITNNCGRNVIVLSAISRQNDTSAVIFLKGESKEAFSSFFYTTAQSEWASERIPFPKRWSNKYICADEFMHTCCMHRFRLESTRCAPTLCGNTSVTSKSGARVFLLGVTNSVSTGQHNIYDCFYPFCSFILYICFLSRPFYISTFHLISFSMDF